MTDKVWTSKTLVCSEDFVEKYRALRLLNTEVVAEINWLNKHGPKGEEPNAALQRLLYLYGQHHNLKLKLADLQNEVINSIHLNENEELYEYQFQLEGRRLWIRLEIAEQPF